MRFFSLRASSYRDSTNPRVPESLAEGEESGARSSDRWKLSYESEASGPSTLLPSLRCEEALLALETGGPKLPVLAGLLVGPRTFLVGDLGGDEVVLHPRTFGGLG